MSVHSFSSKIPADFSLIAPQETDRWQWPAAHKLNLHLFILYFSMLPSNAWACKDVRRTGKSSKLPRHKLFLSSVSNPEPSESRESHCAVNFSVIFLIQSQNTPCIMPSCWTPGRFPREKSASYLLLIKLAVISLCAFSSRDEGQGRRGTNTTCRGTLSEGRRKAEEYHRHASPQWAMARSQHTLVFQIPIFAPFQDPHSHSSSGAQCNTQKQWLPLPSQGSGTNKTQGENSQFLWASSSPELSFGEEAVQPVCQEARVPYPAYSINMTPVKQPPVPYSVLLPLNTGHEVSCQLL